MNTDKTYAESIAAQYAPKETSKVAALRKLDRQAKRPARTFAITFGIVATLLLGTGMCLCMGQLGDGSAAFMTAGVVIGLLGIAGIAANYWIFRRILEQGKRKYGYEIMQLAKEISDQG